MRTHARTLPKTVDFTHKFQINQHLFFMEYNTTWYDDVHRHLVFQF